MKRILVVAPHPDDESLGCGGTLLRHKSNGDHLYWLIMTRLSEATGFSADQIRSRALEIAEVKSEYGFKDVVQLDFETTQLDVIPKSKLVAEVSAVISRVQPTTVYLPYSGDVHTDHKVVFDVMNSCTKSFRYPFIEQILCYETISETEFDLNPESSAFRPNFFVNISSYFDQKIRILSVYKSEMKSHPFPRSVNNVRALATYRGAMSGCDFAEAFILLKEILK